MAEAIKAALAGRPYSPSKLKSILYKHFPATDTIKRQANASMLSIYKTKVEKGGILNQHPGVDTWTLNRIAPKLRSELDKRIASNINLIVLNRDASAANTIRRYEGWISSLTGVNDVVKVGEITDAMTKEYNKVKFYQRRVDIDQGHKFVSAVSNIIATENRAIAAVWHSQFKRLNYNYRKEHKDRDGEVYLIRGSWADEEGLVKPGKAGYSDEITQPGEEVYCSCYFQYIYSLRKIPIDMLTKKGLQQIGQ